MTANVLGTVAALFTGQANNIGPALATEVKKVPDPIHIQIQFVRPPSPPPSSDPRWLSQLMIVRSFPQSDLDRFGNPQRHTAGIILRVCGEIPRISARLPSEKKESRPR